jgi:predicted AAA+ superfamily ATPase
MMQLFNHLLENNYLAKNILYFSFDLYKSNPHDVFKAYSELMAIDLENQEIMIFFDEIQYVKGWASKIKVYNDH